MSDMERKASQSAYHSKMSTENYDMDAWSEDGWSEVVRVLSPFRLRDEVLRDRITIIDVPIPFTHQIYPKAKKMNEFEWIKFRKEHLDQDTKVVYRFHVIEEYEFNQDDLAEIFWDDYSGDEHDEDYFTSNSTAADIHDEIIRMGATPTRLYDSILNRNYPENQHIVQNVGVKFVKSGGFPVKFTKNGGLSEENE